jgi:hypothetical protein
MACAWELLDHGEFPLFVPCCQRVVARSESSSLHRPGRHSAARPRDSVNRAESRADGTRRSRVLDQPPPITRHQATEGMFQATRKPVFPLELDRSLPGSADHRSRRSPRRAGCRAQPATHGSAAADTTARWNARPRQGRPWCAPRSVSPPLRCTPPPTPDPVPSTGLHACGGRLASAIGDAHALTSSRLLASRWVVGRGRPRRCGGGSRRGDEHRRRPCCQPSVVASPCRIGKASVSAQPAKR